MQNTNNTLELENILLFLAFIVSMVATHNIYNLSVALSYDILKN